MRRQLDFQKVDEIEETLPERIRIFEETFISLNQEIEFYQGADREKERLLAAKKNLESKIQGI